MFTFTIFIAFESQSHSNHNHFSSFALEYLHTKLQVQGSLIAIEKSFLFYFYTAAREWKPIRKMLNPAFNMKILQSFIPIFNAKTNILLENLSKETNGRMFNVLTYMNSCTLDMISGTTMGFNLEIQRNKNSDFLYGIEV